MSGFFATLPGDDIALRSADYVAQHGRSMPMSDAVLLLPTRRSIVMMRDAFRRRAPDTTQLLPRMIPLAEIGDELITLLGHPALPLLAAIPPAMAPHERLYVLAAQVQRFEQARGSAATLDHALRLAEQLAELQDRCTRAERPLDRTTLAALFSGDYAEHWQQSAAFLSIIAETWPLIEQESGKITQAAREVAMLQALTQHWRETPPNYPVIATGSTGSQTATAALLATIASQPHGAVILPAFDARIDDAHWARIGPAHPYHHMKTLLTQANVSRDAVTLFGDSASPSIWLPAFDHASAMPHWRETALPPHQHLQHCACAHAEDESRTIALILRHGIEETSGRIALVTPDESLMARVDAHLARFGLHANRLSQGSLAQTSLGQLYGLLLDALDAPESQRAFRALLQHPLVALGEGAQHFLAAYANHARGVSIHGLGQLPALPAALREQPTYHRVRAIAHSILTLARSYQPASAWLSACQALLETLADPASLRDQAMEAALAGLDGADMLGRIDGYGWAKLLRRVLETPVRAPQFHAHPQLFMLTPVEARLHHFEWVVLGNMQDAVWPGHHRQNPWLNHAQQQQLGLPGFADQAARMAHDVLQLGSSKRVFMTHRLRDAGSPVPRSRFIERLFALLAIHRVAEQTLACAQYHAIAHALDAAPHFSPAAPPRIIISARPARLPVTALDLLFRDPYSLYARYVLALEPLDAWDAEPDARDFGMLAHAAIQQLVQHWNDHNESPAAATLEAIADAALAPFSARPTVQLFWRARLIAGLHFVAEQEAHRRAQLSSPVLSEQQIEQPLTGDGLAPNILYGRIDRLETATDGATVIDYKTGRPPTVADMRLGRAVQLLGYALLLRECGQPIHALEYWGLPAGKRGGTVERLDWNAAEGDALLGPLRDALRSFFTAQAPLLARPFSSQDRFTNDYDGISRYDEWAG